MMEIEHVTIKTPNKGDVVWAIRVPCHCGIYADSKSGDNRRKNVHPKK